MRKCRSLKQRHWQFQTPAARECLPKCCHSGLPKWKKNRHTSFPTKEIHPAREKRLQHRKFTNPSEMCLRVSILTVINCKELLHHTDNRCSGWPLYGTELTKYVCTFASTWTYHNKATCVFNALAVDREGLKPFRTFQYQRKTCLAFPVFLFPESPLPGGKDKDIEPGTASCCNNPVWLCGALQSPCYNALSTSLSCCPVEIRQSIQIPNIYSILIFFLQADTKA